MLTRTHLPGLAALSFVCLLSSHVYVSAQTSHSLTVKAEAPARTAYVLGPDDLIVIHALDVPDISEKPQRIDANGDLKMPLIGRVHSAGLTVEQLETELIDRLRTFVKEPDVLVTVSELRSQTVAVLGAVMTPGVQQLESGKTLIEVLSKAGGPTADAGPVVRITRRLDQGRIPLAEAKDNEETGYSVAEVPLGPLLNARAPEANIALRQSDVLSVPRAEMVYVVGEVNKIGQVPLTRGDAISVVEAISASGGLLRTAAGNHARILRATEGMQTRTEIGVDVNKIMQGRANDVSLVAGDILIVPNSGSKRAATRAVDAAIQLGILFGSYGIVR